MKKLLPILMTVCLCTYLAGCGDSETVETTPTVAPGGPGDMMPPDMKPDMEEPGTTSGDESKDGDDKKNGDDTKDGDDKKNGGDKKDGDDKKDGGDKKE